MDPESSIADILAKLSIHFSDARPLIPMYIHLILSAIFPIYAGAHASLSRPPSAAKPVKKTEESTDSEDEDEDEDTIQKMEGMSNKDAIVLPITAALVLAGLYYLIMKYGADLINLILGWYFSGVGVYSVGKFINDALEILVNFVFPTYYSGGGSLWRVSSSERKFARQDGNKATRDGPDAVSFYAFALPKSMRKFLWNLRRDLKHKHLVKAYARNILDVQAKLTAVNAFSAFVGIATIVYVNTVSKHWILTNLQGFAVSYAALQLMSPTTFATGSLILGALFCYDIWAVFFTPLMVTVAKNLDQPIKLVFPRPDEPSKTPGKPPAQSFSMLGLGDIVLPGIMIGLALRFDLYLFYLRKQKTTRETKNESDGQSTKNEVVEKAPYVSVTGHWGDRFWTYWLSTSLLPPQLRSSFPKPYFTSAMIGYVIGMFTTLGVMSVFQHAQPALLYLVPGVLISLWGTALVRGELREMWEFSEALTGDQLENDDSKVSETEQSSKGLFERLWHEIWTGSEVEKKEDKSTEAEKEKPSATGQSKTNDENEDGPNEKKDRTDDDILVSFTVTRLSTKSVDSAGQRKGIQNGAAR